MYTDSGSVTFLLMMAAPAFVLVGVVVYQEICRYFVER